MKFAPDANDKLLVSCWDKNVYYYQVDTSSTGQSTLHKIIEHRAPVLDVCFGDDHTVAFSGGLDWVVYRYNRCSSIRLSFKTLTSPTDLTSRRAKRLSSANIQLRFDLSATAPDTVRDPRSHSLHTHI